MIGNLGWGRELAFAARRLRRAPGFAAVGIAALAIGIGVNAAMFGLIDGLLFRAPAHVTDPDRVVRVQFTRAESPGSEPTRWGRAYYLALRDLEATGVFQSVAGYLEATLSVGRGSDATEARGQIVTPNFFAVLGVRPRLGSLTRLDEATGGTNSVVISEGFWQRRFGAKSSVIGAPIQIGTSSYVVAGVAPNGFTSLQDKPVDVWLPMNDLASGYLPREWRTRRGSFYLLMVGRVPGAVSVDVAARRASDLLRVSAQGDRDPTGIATSPLISSRDTEKSREVRVSLWLAAVTGLVLLIACANVGNLVMARNVARGREYAVRLSLGASHWQLRRHLIADVCGLILPGVLAGMVIEYWVRMTIPKFLSAEIPLAQGLVDGRAAVLIALSSALATVLVVVVSLVQVRPAKIALALKAHAEDTRGSAVVRSVLVSVQSGLCVALLFSAGLFAQSLTRVLSLDLGVELDRTVQVSFNVPRGGVSVADQQSLYERALTRLREHPGVESAALATSDPFQSGSGSMPFTTERSRREEWEGRGEVAYSAAVGGGFFTASGAKTLVGRDFTDDDNAGAPRVAIINRNLATRLLPGKDALGHCVFLEETRECIRVVGVLGGVWKLRALDRSKMTIYTPIAQTEDAEPGAILIRTRGSAGRMLDAIRMTVQNVEPNAPAVHIARAHDLIDWEIRPWRLGATLFAGFAAIALVIAAVGIFGVVSFTATMRVREIGIRMALGARGAHIARVVAGSGLGAVVVGLLVGSLASLLATRWVGDVLYETSPRDPVILARTAAILLGVAVVAVVVPVVRALRLAPAAILRSD